MAFYYFLFGFVSAFAFLGAIVVVGGKKGHEYIQTRLEELKEEQAANPKKQEALKLEAVKQTATVKMEIMAAGRSNHSIKARLSLTGTKLKVHVFEEKTKENPEGGPAEKPVAILVTTGILCRKEDRLDARILHLTSKEPAVSPLFKDERDGQADWLRADLKFDTVRECERWDNILNANDRTVAWKSHVKSLPSVDVFNVFLSRVLFNLNDDPEFEQLISKKISKKLDSVKLPLSGGLRLNTLTVGKQIPFIEGVSFISYNSTGEFAFDFNLTYGGGFSLQLVAELHLRNVALPPVIITVEVEKLEGNVHMSVGAPPSNKVWVGFHEAPKIQLNIKQEVHTGKQGGLLSHFIKAIPDLSDVITDVVKVKLFEDMILPNMDDISLPDVKKTPPNTPAQESLTPGGVHQTTFGPGGNQGSHVASADHPKPAGYPGTGTHPAQVAAVAAAVAAAKKEEVAAQKKEESSAAAAATPPVTPAKADSSTSPASTPVVDESPKKKPVAAEGGAVASTPNRQAKGGSRRGGGADGDEMEEMQSITLEASSGEEKKKQSDASASEEKEQLDALKLRSEQRSNSMKETINSTTASSSSSSSNDHSLPVGYPGGSAVKPVAGGAATPYGASPYASQTARKKSSDPAAVATGQEEPNPSGFVGTVPAGGTQQQQYTYNVQQPQWSSNSQPQWGK